MIKRILYLLTMLTIKIYNTPFLSWCGCIPSAKVDRIPAKSVNAPGLVTLRIGEFGEFRKLNKLFSCEFNQNKK